MLVNKTTFASKQITDYRFVAYQRLVKNLAPSIVFNCMILQFMFNSLENSTTILYRFEKHSGQVVLLEGSFACLYHKSLFV